jgi:hypothetical protein
MVSFFAKINVKSVVIETHIQNTGNRRMNLADTKCPRVLPSELKVITKPLIRKNKLTPRYPYCVNGLRKFKLLGMKPASMR